jgi:hypothetical protein
VIVVAEHTVTVTRWMLLRLLPGAWLHACRVLGMSPLRPAALWLFIRAFWALVVPHKSGA